MTLLEDIRNYSQSAVTNLLERAHDEQTYADAIKFLKHEQDKQAREGEKRGDDFSRAINILGNRIYSEAIYLMNKEAKEQSIK